MTNSTQPRPFDERAALEELERLAERIQASRRQREEAVAEFDAFVKTFRDDQYAARLRAVEAAAPAAPPPSAPAATPVTAPEPQPAHATPSGATSQTPESAFPSERTESDREQESPAPPVFHPMPAPERAVAVARASSTTPARSDLLSAPYTRWILAAAGVLLLVLVILWMRTGSSAPQATKPPAPGPAAANTRPETAVPPPVASSGPARALNVQMVTVRPVWARVTVDDKKVIEREIPGGQTIPLAADRAISIRAGDAGAVRLIVDGKDQGPLGRAGQPATRTLTASR
ncbi:MAG TPA: DUF4115 domain-containing protein [Vicinamibacterales bacterium]|nr:DUF4115 domain-containing protein [Vicinamibacterales bacterium]